MFNLDLLAQIYLISFFVGSFFIVFNVLIGQIGHFSSGHHGIGDHGLHHGVGDHSGAGHHATSRHSHIGHGAGHTNGASHSGHAVHHGLSSHGASHGDLNNSNPLSWLGNYVSINVIHRLRRRLLVFVEGEDIPSRIGMFLIAWLSPMRIAIWLTFFGLSGFFIERLFPWLFILSLIPALLIAMVASAAFNNLISWTMDSLQSSGVSRQEDVIGSVAEVQTPMTSNLIGEIVYKLDSGRTNCAAKPAKAGLEIKRGAKVMIVGMQGHIALVEPVTDPVLLEDSQ